MAIGIRLVVEGGDVKGGGTNWKDRVRTRSAGEREASSNCDMPGYLGMDSV